MKLSRRLGDMAWSALIATMLCYTLSTILMNALTTDVPRITVLLYSAAAVVLCAIVAINTITSLAAVGATAVAAIWCWRARYDLFGAIRGAFTGISAIIWDTGAAKSGDALLLLGFLCLFFGILSLLTSSLVGGVYPAALLLIFALFGAHFLHSDPDIGALVPGFLALAVLYARAYRESTAIPKAIPAAALAVALCVALNSIVPSTYQPLQDAADRARELFNDYFQFNDPRVVYTVASDGYQPLVDLLGGPASPRQGTVMAVETDEKWLLRGAVSRTYTGANWVDDTVNNRYLFIDLTRMNRREGAFDVDLIDNLRGQAHRARAEITFLNPGTSTLFVPERLTNLTTPYDTPVYYNEKGETFITHDVEPGDSYALEAWVLEGDLADLREAVVRASSQSDPGYQEAVTSYTSLPAGIEDDLYWLAVNLTANAETDFDKALIIKDYLTGEGFSYTIDARYAPEGRDFVSWFVLNERRGYCTYYASAMAVMARLCGIPSRYCEGYAVPSDPSGTTIVTGEMAHAWAELYFSGIGWLAFDATPGNGDFDEPGADDGESAETPPPDPTATPVPSPTPTVTPNSDNVPPPTELPESDKAGVTPEPEQADTPAPAPDSATPPPPDSDANRHSASWLWLIVAALAIAAVIYLVRRRLAWVDPARLAARQKDPRDQVMVWYRAVLGLLKQKGLTPEGGETPRTFASRALQGAELPVEIMSLADAVSRLQYSGDDDADEAIRLGEYVYVYILRHMPRRERLMWRLRLMRGGVGDIRSIP